MKYFIAKLRYLALAGVALTTPIHAGTTVGVSVPAFAAQDRGFGSDGPDISANGQHITFASDASDLVNNDNNGVSDIFTYDVTTKVIQRISATIDGQETNIHSNYPSISTDGRFIAYLLGFSRGSVHLYDRDTNETTLISRGLNGAAADGVSRDPKISDDGRFITFTSEANNLVTNDNNESNDFFIYDRTTDTTSLVSLTNNGEYISNAVMSEDGRYIAFGSPAQDLVPNDTNQHSDIFVRDRLIGETVRVSVSSSGVQANSFSFIRDISANGRYIVFTTEADNLVSLTYPDKEENLFIHDMATRQTTQVSRVDSEEEYIADADIIDDGRYVAFTSTDIYPPNVVDNVNPNAYLLDRQLDTVDLISISSTGDPADGYSYQVSISSDGKKIAFTSVAANLDERLTGSEFNIYFHEVDGASLIPANITAISAMKTPLM